MSLLKLDGVLKQYEKVTAVNNVSFEVPEGAIFGLLGPNGAGKTSIIRMITMITRPDEGEIYVAGKVVGRDDIGRIGYMPEERGLYKKMNVQDHLLYLARLKGLSKADANKALDYWFDRFGIETWRKKNIEELSKGMQQKIQFIATVVHDPTLVILDEPFSGLDPINTNLIKDEIYELAQKGKQIVFSTHRMEQVEEICDYIVLINKGENVLEGWVKDIKNSFRENLFEVQVEGELPESVLSQYTQRDRTREGGYVLQLPEGKVGNELLKDLMNTGAVVTSFREVLPSLNEIFIKHVGEYNPVLETA
ncbi:MAG: ABC transporter ATP-binding protein [Saprospiraceae bacterium]